MTENELLAQEFERSRAHLRAVAYRMLGSLSEADDAVQESWLRLSRSDPEAIDNLPAWLTTVVARVSLDMLRTRRARREDYAGSWLPEPVVSIEDGRTDPEHEALLADSVGLALLVVLDALAPRERLAFVLHDMFAVPFGEIAAIVGTSPDAARQLASRARRRVRGAAPVEDADLSPAARARRRVPRGLARGKLRGPGGGPASRGGLPGRRRRPRAERARRRSTAPRRSRARCSRAERRSRASRDLRSSTGAPASSSRPATPPWPSSASRSSAGGSWRST